MAIFYTDLLMKSLDKDSLMLLSSQPDTEPESDLSDAILVAPTKNLSTLAAPRQQEIVQQTPNMTFFPAGLSSSSASRLAACPKQAGPEPQDSDSSRPHISFEISSGTASSFITSSSSPVPRCDGASSHSDSQAKTSESVISIHSSESDVDCSTQSSGTTVDCCMVQLSYASSSEMSESEVNRVSQSSGTTVDCCEAELSNASSSDMSGSDSRSSRSSFAIETSEEDEDSLSPVAFFQKQDVLVPDRMGDLESVHSHASSASTFAPDSTGVVPDLNFLAYCPVLDSSSPTPTAPSGSAPMLLMPHSKPSDSLNPSTSEDCGATTRAISRVSRRGQSQRISEANKDVMRGRDNITHLVKTKVNSTPHSSQRAVITQPTPLESASSSPASTSTEETNLESWHPWPTLLRTRFGGYYTKNRRIYGRVQEFMEQKKVERVYKMTDGKQRSRCVPDVLVDVFFEYVKAFVSTARDEVRGPVVGGKKEEEEVVKGVVGGGGGAGGGIGEQRVKRKRGEGVGSVGSVVKGVTTVSKKAKFGGGGSGNQPVKRKRKERAKSASKGATALEKHCAETDARLASMTYNELVEYACSEVEKLRPRLHGELYSRSGYHLTRYEEILQEIMPEFNTLSPVLRVAIDIGVRRFLDSKMGNRFNECVIPTQSPAKNYGVPDHLVCQFKVWIRSELEEGFSGGCAVA
ncbi:hypothetical protein HDU98_010773 [Podochytrium sp. JEL0797]|nr:hypothetical protein HDU98_010773 [Podochytrium sp. JEL0797]